MDCALEINQVTVAYGNRIAVNDITASLPRRQITAIIGPNGSGKSTLLKAAVGLIPVQKGAFRILGLPFAQARHFTAYVPQQDEVDWHYPILVWEVVALGRFQPGNIFFRPSAGDRRIVIEALRRVGMEEYIFFPIGQLSGGQRQRVFLARALAQQAELYLLDEPFSGVDAKTEEVILDHIKELKNEGKSVVLVHHKLGEVAGSFDHVLMLNRELIGFGPTELTFTEELIRLTYGTPFHKEAPRPSGSEENAGSFRGPRRAV